MKANVKNYGIKNGQYFLIEPNTGVKITLDNYKIFVKYYNKWYTGNDILEYKKVLKDSNFAIYNVVRYRSGNVRFVCNNASGFCYSI